MFDINITYSFFLNDRLPYKFMEGYTHTYMAHFRASFENTKHTIHNQFTYSTVNVPYCDVNPKTSFCM